MFFGLAPAPSECASACGACDAHEEVLEQQVCTSLMDPRNVDRLVPEMHFNPNICNSPGLGVVLDHRI